MWVTSLQGLTVLIDDNHVMRSLGKLHHIVAQTNHEARQSGHIGRSEELCLLVSGRTEVHTFLHQLLRCLVPLQLSTPEATEIHIDLTIVVLEHAGIDTHRTADGLCLRYERTFWLVGDGHTKVEHTVIVFGREDQIVLSVFLHDVIIPHLLLSPGHLFDIENDTMISNLTVLDIVQRKHMIVLHLEMSTVIVEGCASLPVMRRIDVEPAVKHIGRGVCHIITRKQIAW